MINFYEPINVFNMNLSTTEGRKDSRNISQRTHPLYQIPATADAGTKGWTHFEDLPHLVRYPIHNLSNHREISDNLHHAFLFFLKHVKGWM